MSTDQDQLKNIRHSLAHLLASAVLQIRPDAQLGVGPTIDNGFYYDFLLNEPITPDELKQLEKLMKKQISGKLDFTREDLDFDSAKKFFEDKKQPFKVELIVDIQQYGTSKADRSEDLEVQSTDQGVSLYHTGEFVDLCRGGHVANTSEINADAFKLDKLAGAYWRGDEKNCKCSAFTACRN
ncbi:MAG: hypothetical protein R3B41_01780 [Candidatus Doudnabacteria bacterium]